MSNSTMAAVLTYLLPLLGLGGTAFLTWLSVILVRYTKDKRIAASFQVLAVGAAGVAAHFAQHIIPDLKDPTKSGSWNKIAQAELKQAGIATLKKLYPQTVALVRESLTSDEALNQVLGNMLEQAVVAAKGPKLTAAVQIGTAGPTTVNVNEAAPAPAAVVEEVSQ
jgi:hypothetical protein